MTAKYIYRLFLHSVSLAQIIRHIRAVKSGVLQMGGDLERDGNPTLKYHRLTVGSRPYLLIPQHPGEYRVEHIRAMEREKQKLLDEENMRYLLMGLIVSCFNPDFE